MEGATIVVKNLGNENLEKAIYESLMAATKRYVGWTICVMGAHNNDKWVVSVESPSGIKSPNTELTLHDNQTAQRVAQIVIDLIAVVQAA
jgi:hypothetical protein